MSRPPTNNGYLGHDIDSREQNRNNISQKCFIYGGSFAKPDIYFDFFPKSKTKKLVLGCFDVISNYYYHY